MRNPAIWSVVLGLAVLTAGYGKEPDTTGPAQEVPPTAEKQITLDLGGGVTMELVLIPAGSFMMGDAKGDADEKPVHKVTITRPFCLGKYEVTQEQWQAVMGSNPSKFKGPKNPVEMVSWDDCQDFLTKLNEKLAQGGEKFTLPTEAQWEYACRAGSTTRWCFGNDNARLGEYAWYDGNSDRKTHPVGQKKPNAWGLYDVHGNVWEWGADRWGRDYYKQSPPTDPTGPASGNSRVLRGGSFIRDYPGFFRCAYRDHIRPNYREHHCGFRVARTLAP